MFWSIFKALKIKHKPNLGNIERILKLIYSMYAEINVLILMIFTFIKFSNLHRTHDAKINKNKQFEYQSSKTFLFSGLISVITGELATLKLFSSEYGDLPHQ